MFSELWEKVSDVEVFTASVRDWISGISINSVIILIMMIFMIVGAVDKLRGNKLGYGQDHVSEWRCFIFLFQFVNLPHKPGLLYCLGFLGIPRLEFIFLFQFFRKIIQS